MEEPSPGGRTLDRRLTAVGVLLLTFSALSPVASVFISGPSILHLAGSGAVWAFLIGGTVAAVLALLYAELGAAYPRAGGPYPAIGAILGPGWAFPFIALELLVAPCFLAFSALGFADYVRVLLPSLPALPIAYAALATAGLVAILNIQAGAVVTGAFLAVEAVALLFLAVVAGSHPARGLPEVLAHPVLLQDGFLKPAGVAAIALGTVGAAWTAAGANWAMYFGEEMKDAQRRIGGVIALTGVVAALIIAGPVILTVLSAPDMKAMLASEAPIAAFLKQTGGPLAAAVVSLGVLTAVFNNLIAASLGYSRLIFSTGRDGVWGDAVSGALARLNRFRAPWAATAVLTVAAVLAALFGERVLLIVQSGEVVCATVLLSLAVIAGRRRGLTGATFRTPLHPLVPVFGLALTFAFLAADWMDPDAGRPSLFLLAALLCASVAWWWFRLRTRSSGWLTAPVTDRVTEEPLPSLPSA